MGKVANTERLKVRATYWNGVAIALTSSGVVAPFISIYLGDFNKVSFVTGLVIFAAIFAGQLCRWMAEATINEIKD